MNAFAQLTATLSADSGLAGDPTSAAFMPIIGKPLTVTKVVDGKKVVKANRKAAKPLITSCEDSHGAVQVFNVPAVGTVEVTTTKASDHAEWVAMQAENLRCAGFAKDDLSIVDGKRFRLTSGGKTLTWFTERQWAEDILAAL